MEGVGCAVIVEIFGGNHKFHGGVGVAHSGQLADESNTAKQQNVTSGVLMIYGERLGFRVGPERSELILKE